MILRKLSWVLAVGGATTWLACAGPGGDSAGASPFVVPPELQGDGPRPDLALPTEVHLTNVYQMTFGGRNAQAHWSFDDDYLIFQSTRDDTQCDQIFIMDAGTGGVQQVTTQGRTTCPFFLPDSDRILFASTHAAGTECPPEPGRDAGYVWPVYESYDIYTADRDGTNLVNITNSPGYDAEATVSQDGTIIFTSSRSGDLELWTMDTDGGNLEQITDTPGYDGGAFFSQDGSKIVWCASRFELSQDEDEYFELLGQGLVRPTDMQIWIADADGTNARQLTDNGKTNFAPYFTPDGDAVLFSSNMDAPPPGRSLEIWKLDLDGNDRVRVTWDDTFNSFPMFSWSGERLVFSSNRNGAAPTETNIFLADWQS